LEWVREPEPASWLEGDALPENPTLGPKLPGFEPVYPWDRPDLLNLLNSPIGGTLNIRCKSFTIQITTEVPNFGPKPPGPVSDVPPNDGYQNPKGLTIGGRRFPPIGVQIISNY
jgi:hypothetical protein